MDSFKIENLMAPTGDNKKEQPEVQAKSITKEVRSELFQLGHRLESAIDMAKDACNYEYGSEVAFRVGEAYVYMRQCLAELRELENRLGEIITK